MPTFVAKETSPPARVRPEEPLPHIADGTAINIYYHRSKTDTVREVCRPGRFNFMPRRWPRVSPISNRREITAIFCGI